MTSSLCDVTRSTFVQQLKLYMYVVVQNLHQKYAVSDHELLEESFRICWLDTQSENTRCYHSIYLYWGFLAEISEAACNQN